MTRPTDKIDYPFTPVSNEMIERLAGFPLSGRKFRIILFLMRKTWGWGKDKDKIPMSQFARFTGIDRRHCHAILTSLIKQKIINKTVTTRGDRKAATYSFNDVYSEWKLSPPMVTKAKVKTVTTRGDRLSPSTVTNLSPSLAHSIDTERNLLKESGGGLSELLDAQSPPPIAYEKAKRELARIFHPKTLHSSVDIEAKRSKLRKQAAILLQAEQEGTHDRGQM